MAIPKERSIYAYSLHARSRDELVDYPRFFEALADVDPPSRRTSVGDEMVAISYMDRTERGWLLRFVSGEEGVPPLFYDPVTGRESFGALTGLAVRGVTWVLVDPETRIVAVERRRPGVGVGQIAAALGHIAAEMNLVEFRPSFDLNPVVSKSFADEVERYERIRVAAVVLARPNFSWGDNAAALTDYADDSNADDVEVSMSARRGGSLSKSDGIVADILNVTKSIVGPVKNLRIVGRRQGESKETAVSLKRHHEKRTFAVASEVTPHAEREAFEVAGNALIRDVASRERDTGDVEPQ